MTADGPEIPSPRPLAPFTYRWPDLEERYERGWETEMAFRGRRVRIRHGLGRRAAYGRERLRAVTWIDGAPIVEGVEEDDYPSTRRLLSIVRRLDNKHARSLAEVPDTYRGFELVEMIKRIRAPWCPRSIAIRLPEDDVAAWARLALARLEAREPVAEEGAAAAGQPVSAEPEGVLIEETSFVGPSPGLQVLLDLEDGLDPEDASRHLRAYAQTTGYDRSLNRLRSACPDGVDPRDPTHRDALLQWLREWGCRHLRRQDNASSSAALAEWADAWLERLPPSPTSLPDLDASGLRDGAIAFGALAGAPAAVRRRQKRDTVVRFGPTAAAKALHVIRPNAFPPWDDPIRRGLGLGDNDAAYLHYLKVVAAALRQLAARLGVPVLRLPAAVGRPDSSSPKLIDEYLWIRITRGGVGGD